MKPFALALALLAAPAAAETFPEAQTHTFICDGGAVLRIAFISRGPDGYAVVERDGVLIPMRQLPAASGVFYVDFDEQAGWRWRGRGDEGFLARLAPDTSAEEVVVLDGCVSTRR
ncbi:MAG: hypothetical protein EA355_16075 [Rhodobacteraceae bacterium]|nr:MAG: hypothetical protein EA355_16075 [Paracoccaceae bacterium]